MKQKVKLILRNNETKHAKNSKQQERIIKNIEKRVLKQVKRVKDKHYMKSK